MDGYPESLAPEFTPSGAVATPFEQWWERVRSALPDVPEEVARHWVHEHWSHSPFGNLKSSEYAFNRILQPSKLLTEIRSGWCNFDQVHEDCKKHGAYLATLVSPPVEYKTAIYMLEHGDFPTPIIALDNRDGHLDSKLFGDVPAAFILVEGHRRFNLGLYLREIDRLKDEVAIWMMIKKASIQTGTSAPSRPTA